MADETRRNVPMPRPERPRERDAVRTTIVGGRPPGSGTDVGPIPRGIEVLVKKAAVDPAFKALLLETRAAAADAIGLTLEPSEAAMLDAVPAAQLAAIVDHTSVSPMTRAAFLGRAATAMLAALGAAAVEPAEAGDMPPPAPEGIRPDLGARFVLYAVDDWKGETAYRVAATGDYGRKVAHTLRANRFLRTAHARAAKAWAAQPRNEGVAFPMPAPRPVACRILGRYGRRELAEAALKKRQQAAKVQRKADEEKEKRRLAALGQADRAKADEQAKHLAAAQQLFQKTLGAIVNELGNAPPPVHGVAGIRISTGIRAIDLDR